MKACKEFWRKNGDEILGLFNGNLPDFVRKPKPRDNPYTLPVFCYHVVDKDSFVGDMRFLHKNDYKTLHGEHLLAVLKGERPIGVREIVLTFDDGAINTLEVAHPLLRDWGFQALLFVCPGLVRDIAPDHAERLCTWEELRQLEESGHWDVQCHTWAHRSIPRWPESVPLTGADPASLREPDPLPDQLSEDLALAKETLEQRLNKTCDHLAWPEYLSTPEARKTAAGSGFAYTWGGLGSKGGMTTLPAPGAEEQDIPRVSNDFLKRLPGKGRCSLASVAAGRTVSKVRS